MIHGIGSKNAYTNVLRESGSNYIKNTSTADGKTGIYGYTSKDTTKSIITDILGDKNDYKLEYIQTSTPSTINSVFGVAGWRDSSFSMVVYPVAWYWTIIANKVLTTDQINQVIAYFNLDRCVEPTVLYDVKRQGLSNYTPDSDWYLKDFSKNGFDMSLFNFAKKGGSGVAAKQGESIEDYYIIKDEEYQELTIYNEFKFKIKSKLSDRYWTVQYINRTNTSYPVTIVIDKDAYWVNSTTYYDADNNKQVIRKNIPIAADTPTNVLCCGYDQFDIPEDATSIVSAVSYVYYNAVGEITVEFIPSCKGGLITDGVNDYGKVTGLPIYKDYTVVTDREIFANIGAISSKNNPGAFVETAGNTVYSFGQATSGLNFISTRSISYLSKYSYCGQSITAGAAEDGTDMWLGTIRDNDTRFFNGAIYSLMSFPYSMSEFLIERQLKKHKLGTLYPDMVEFRPVIKANNDYEIVYTAIIKPDNWQEISIGDYVTVGKSVAIQIKLNLPLEVTNVSSNSLADVSFYKEETGDNVYTIYGRLLDGKSPQKINITIDEYIRYEDIVQPYPVLLRFKDENGNEVSWGGKFKVGSTITRIGSIADPESNLLNGLYSISGLSLNGKGVTSNTSIVEKQMVFKTIATYLLDNNEPKCILSPRLLRIPNSSYKILGYIPDISGHGNHGKINNSAYAGASGANGYKQDFTSWKTNGSGYSIVTDSKYILTNEKAITNGGYFLWNRLAKDSFKVKISNIPNGGWMSYRYKVTEEDTQVSSLFIREDGIYTLPATIADSEVDFFISTVSAPAEDWIGLTIEQIGEYDGAYCLDGVDDFVTIPTLSIGGKQVLMKTNWLKSPALLYDQRASGGFAILTTNEDDATNPRIAYQARNQNGKTYVDGIENNYIETYSLKGIVHNITVTNPSAGSGVVPVIGANTGKSNSFAEMSLYDFMLFDEISTDEEIKQLNDIVGIEGGYVQKPPYYWDAYGKTNSDDDRSTIQQRGTAVGDYDLTNHNHAYEGMSGYNGYPIILSGTNKTYQDKASYVNVVGDDTNIISITRISFTTAAIFSYIKQNGTLTDYNRNIESCKVKVTGLQYDKFVVKYSYINSVDATARTVISITSDGIYELPKSFASDGSLTSSDVWIGINFTKQSTDIPDIIEDVNVTIEVLPEYENGLVYDGVEDFSDNKNVPIIDDFTVIAKRTWLEENISDKPFIIKGDTLYPDGNQNAFLFEYGKLSTYSFGQNNKYDESVVPSLISWATPTSYNGTTSLVRGSAIDTVGIDIAHATKMVLYKLILYPKTISLLEINFLKNLMEKDEIIDLNNPIFIQ